MKKTTVLLALLAGLFTFASAEDYGEVKFDFDEEAYFAVGGIFNKVSNNGKYVVGHSEPTSAAFYYDVELGTITLLNPEINTTEETHYYFATAYDVSDNGIIVGSYSFEKLKTVPAFYNVQTKQWMALPLNPELAEEPLSEGNTNGEATSISADGKFISGFINTKLDNSTLVSVKTMPVPCVWVNEGDAKNPSYKLQLPLENDHNLIVTQGDYSFEMSDNGKILGGLNTNISGCFNPVIWINNGDGQKLERNILIGKASVDYDEDGGASTGQYFWNGKVSCISPNGEWVVGYHNYNGTGHIPDEFEGEPASVGFKYNTKTKELTDSLFGGLPSFVFDDGEMIFGQSAENENVNSNILSSSMDKKVQAGVKMEMVPGMGKVNYPYLKIQGYVANELVKSDLDINVYTNGKTLYIDGEFTSVEIYSVLGAQVATFNNDREINLENLNNGVYMIRVINDNQFTTKKINL